MSWRASGFRAWVWQRATAIYMALFLAWLGITVAVKSLSGYAKWHNFMADDRVSVATALFFAALLLHSWVGVRDVIIDYVRPFALRLTLLAVVGFGLFATLLWVVRILFVASL